MLPATYLPILCVTTISQWFYRYLVTGDCALTFAFACETAPLYEPPGNFDGRFILMKFGNKKYKVNIFYSSYFARFKKLKPCIQRKHL